MLTMVPFERLHAAEKSLLLRAIISIEGYRRTETEKGRRGEGEDAVGQKGYGTLGRLG